LLDSQSDRNVRYRYSNRSEIGAETTESVLFQAAFRFFWGSFLSWHFESSGDRPEIVVNHHDSMSRV